MVLSYPLKAVVAVCENGGIGNKGSLPWRLPNEMKHFAKLTQTTTDKSKRNAVLMGRITWESIPARFRPLKNRVNVVLSRNKAFNLNHLNTDDNNVITATSLQGAFERLVARSDIESCFIIGGESLFKEAMVFTTEIYLTRILKEFECDIFMPEIDTSQFAELEHDDKEVKEENDIKYQFKIYKRMV